MKAITYRGGQPLESGNVFTLVEQETPEPTGNDILVRVEAVSINPVDTKVRNKLTVDSPPTILGWDAAGVVEAVGDAVTSYQPGDRVFYAGDITRPGSNASHQLVDERIVGKHPQSLSAAEAAAMPLTSITAWEALFDRLKVSETDRGKRLLVIGGAGGVGSIAIQLAKVVAGLEVVATASRPETIDWCRAMGADHVINHREDLVQQFADQGIGTPDYILCLNDTDYYYPIMAELIAPQGMICTIVEGKKSHDLGLLKSKSAGLVWEFMFTRSMYNTPDMVQQQVLLNRISELLNGDQIQSTLNTTPEAMSPQTIRAAHQQLESGRSIGKIVLTEIPD